MKKLFLLSLLALTACESTHHTKQSENSSYWQRTDMTSALYVRGPKAQHMLHQDISSCVSEVKELSRLGTIRDANPPGGIEMNVGLAEQWQSPKGDGPLYTEFRDFHDFESCMNHKGWRRMNYVSPNHMEKAKTNYNTVILGKTHDPEVDAYKKYHDQSHNDQTQYNN